MSYQKGDPSHSLRMTLAFKREILKQVQDDRKAVVKDDNKVCPGGQEGKFRMTKGRCSRGLAGSILEDSKV